MDDLALALALADAADAISMDRFQASDLVVETKPDMTPVSDADQAVERALRQLLAEHRPDDAIHGEEFGTTDGKRQWIIDPIDGTKGFVRGVPVWGTLIGLREGSAITTGVVSAPALARRWWASPNHGAYCSAPGRTEPRGPLRVSAVTQIADASFAFSDSIGWSPGAFERMMTSTWRQRGHGDFWAHLMVAEGVVDIAAEPALKVHDVAALVPIIGAAGGAMSTFTGAALPWNDPTAEFSLVTTNSSLHSSVLDLLRV
jgi:histidinol-phosphatase